MGKRRALRLGLVGIIGLSSLGIMAEAGAQQAYDLEGTVIGARTVAPGSAVTYRVTLASEPGLEADHVQLRLYGPNDDCNDAPIHQQTFPVAGGQLVYQTTSAPLAPGAYQWVADWGNATHLDSELCGDPDGQFTVTSNSVAARMRTVASPDVVLGGQVWDVATLSNLPLGQGASVTFRLYGPDDATCSRTPAFSTSEPANSTTIVSDAFTPGLPGHYRWVASYFDGFDVVLQGSCNDPDEDVFVWSNTPHLPPTTVPDPSRLRIEVQKTPEPASRPAPGGTFTFHIRVTNHSAVSVTLHDLDDSMHGDLDGVGTCATPQHIGVGASYDCWFEGPFIGGAGDSETNIVIARASRRGYADVGDRDEATIHLTDPVPTTTTTVAPTTTTPVTVLGNQIARTGSEARLMTLWAILVLSVGAMFVVVAIDLHLRREARQGR